jgi:hypothetical protein
VAWSVEYSAIDIPKLKSITVFKQDIPLRTVALQIFDVKHLTVECQEGAAVTYLKVSWTTVILAPMAIFPPTFSLKYGAATIQSENSFAG